MPARALPATARSATGSSAIPDSAIALASSLAILCALLAFGVGTLDAQALNSARSNGGPTRAAPLVATAVETPTEIEIDGRANDAIWATAPKHRGFRTFEPTVDSVPKHETEFQVAYDARNLYVFVRMFDSHPDSIMRALSRRDQRAPSDQIKLLIDSYNDKRSGYEFAVNPDGVKRDYAMSNDGNEDGSWDGIWDVATTIDAEGWTAEFRIPLSQMRYAPAEEHTFGFGIWRDLERYRERSAWPVWRPTVQGISSQLGQLTGLRGLTTARRIEATPYIVSKNLRKPTASPIEFDRNQEFTIGGDVKIGLTSNITLDATVNPDFGQVEADPAVVNLTAFESFFGERRPFFVEGSGFYSFPLNCYIVQDCGTNETLFYSRRIGRAPSLSGIYGDANTATATPIAAAAKITGQTAGGLSFGFLDAVTQRVGGAGGATAEPKANYAVFRANQDLRGGDAGMSLIATATTRSLDGDSEDLLRASAYTAGATFRNRFGQRNYEVAGQLAATHVSGTADVIAATQRAPQRYYQRPDDGLAYDPARTSLSGMSAQVKVGKYGGGITRFETSLIHFTPGFETNDIGFLRRADLTNFSTWAALSVQEKRWIYRWAQLNGNVTSSWNKAGTNFDNWMNVNGHMGLLNNWDVHLGGTLGGFGAMASDRESRGGPDVGMSPFFSAWGGVNTDSRKRVSGGVWFNSGRRDEGNSHWLGFDPYLNFRPSSQMTLGFGFGWSNETSDRQYVGTFTDIGGTHYSFAQIDQSQTSMSVRLNYTATRDLSFELYAAPFIARGEYSEVKELSGTPEAPDYDDRYVPYTPAIGDEPQDFKVLDLRGNAVMRWEYRPGSTLFVVWQHGKSNYREGALTSQSMTQDYNDLFDLQANNTFLVKFAYWFSR